MVGFNSFTGNFFSGRKPGVTTDLTRVANLSIWFNSDIANTTNFGTTPASGDAVTSWKDRSGATHDLNQSGNASVKPKWIANAKNNYGVLRFDGVDESLNINPVPWLQSLSGFTLFTVVKFNSASGTQSVCNTDTGGFRIFSDGTHLGVSAGGSVATSTQLTNTSLYNIYGLIYDGSGATNSDKLRFRFNRTNLSLSYNTAVASTTSASAAKFYVGCGSTGSSEFFNGDITELLIWTRALNSSEIINVESYLKFHWALTV